MSTLSARLKFTKPSLVDRADLEASFSSMEDTLDKAAMWDSGAYGARPVSTVATPGIKGRIYYAEDTGDEFRDLGTRWAYAGKALGEVFAVPCVVSAAMIADGLLPCDGRLIAKLGLYSMLFTRVGHTYNGGADPGGGNFRIPDLRGRMPVSPDDVGTGDAGRLSANQALGATGGEEKHTLSQSELAAHAHALDPTGAGWWVPKSEVIPDEAAFAAGTAGRTMNVGTGGHVDAMQATNDQGGDQPHNNMQPFQIVTWAIRAA